MSHTGNAYTAPMPEAFEWERDLIEGANLTPGLCTTAGCHTAATHSDPAAILAGLPAYRCPEHAAAPDHIQATPRHKDAMWGFSEYTAFIASPELTRANALRAALTRDALLTPAERGARHAVTLARLRDRLIAA